MSVSGGEGAPYQRGKPAWVSGLGAVASRPIIWGWLTGPGDTVAKHKWVCGVGGDEEPDT